MFRNRTGPILICLQIALTLALVVNSIFIIQLQMEKIARPLGTDIDNTAIFNVALVDINGDGWLDIFGTTYLQGNFYLLSDEGRFTSAALRQPPRGNSVLSSTVSFGDIDRDGDLDAVVGNWFAGASKKHPPPHSQNEVWINEDGVFEVQALE